MYINTFRYTPKDVDCKLCTEYAKKRGCCAGRCRWLAERMEAGMIEQKMAQVGTDNLSAYLRKIAIDGYIVKLDLPELREMISLLRRSSNNLNQIAKRLNETGRFYAADLEDMLRRQEQLWQAANRILSRLAMVG